MKTLHWHNPTNGEALLGVWRDVTRKDITVSEDVRQPDGRKLLVNDHGERRMEPLAGSWLHEEVQLFHQGNPDQQQHRQVPTLPPYSPVILRLLTDASVAKEAATAAFLPSPWKL